MDSTEPDADILEVERGAFEMVPHWVLFHPDVTANGIRLYLVLRSFAMGKGVAFPSRRRLAEALNVSIPTLDSAKKNLVAIGAIIVEERTSLDGDPTSNLYKILWGSQESLPTPPKKLAPGWERKLDTKTDVLETNKLDIRTTSIVRKPVETDDAFDQFWSIYPRKQAKGHAKRAWAQAIRKCPVPVIIAGAARYRDDPNREKEFTAMAATWLNAERWEDEPLPQRTGKTDAAADMIRRAAEREMLEIE